MTPNRTLCALLLTLTAGALLPSVARAADEAEPGVESAKAAPAAAAKPLPAVTPKEDTPEVEAPKVPSSAKKRSVAGAGASAQDTLVSGQAVGGEQGETDDWKFQFKGFFRAPMRLGFGEVNPGQGSGIYSPPVVPDGNYTTWQYTNANPGPWVEMLFQYGSSHVMMTTAIASYNITTGGWRELQDQLGIDRAFVTLKYPDALGDRGGLSWDVGVFSNRYGTAGRYDAGAYETYLFGRTRAAGETLTGNIWLNDDLTLVLEHGIGAKLDQQNIASTPVGTTGNTYDPYAGPNQQGSTLLHHAHAALNYQDSVTFTAHYLDTWTKDPRISGPIQNNTMGPPAKATPKPDGDIRIIGADLKFIGGWAGEGYIGFANLKATNATVVSDAIETLHSQGGWQLTNNYFGPDGNGTINSLLLQYQFSLAAFLLRPQPWWGDGSDVVVKVFGMFNSISGQTAAPANGTGTKKLKYGGDILYTPLPTFGFGGRFDIVNPNMDDSTHSFVVLSPRLVFRTRFVTHEQIIVQYQYYSNGSNVQLPYPFGTMYPIPQFQASEGQKSVFTISASMWW